MAQKLTANRLIDGVVLYWRGGDWTESFAEGEVLATKEAADALKGVTLHADRARLPKLPDDEFYHADLIGLDVVDTGGAPLGRVAAILNHGAGDILDVTGGAKPWLIPFTLAAVPTVDLAARRIVVDLPEGLD